MARWAVPPHNCHGTAVTATPVRPRLSRPNRRLPAFCTTSPPLWRRSPGTAASPVRTGLTFEDLDAAEAGVPVRGARASAAEDRSRSRRVYAGPAGHPFRLCAC
ncbi:hypothetical protein KWI83_31870 [Streptomyces sp. TRM70350]|nr:VOC family protein [Streptomyces sp. TRM70350]MBV7700034.1 hypothetical protein [Streptomyces sp. TRM70350]